MDRDLSIHPIFSQMKGTIVRFSKGTTIIQKGEQVEHIYVIAAGLVRSYDIDNQGEKRSGSIFPRSTLFPLTSLIEKDDLGATMYYDAFTDTVCYRYLLDVFKGHLAEDKAALRTTLDILTKAYITQTSRVFNLQKSRLQERIDFILYYLAIRIGSHQDGGIYAIKARLTHQDIADLAGVSREAVTNELSNERYKGVFHKDRGITYIDISNFDADNMPTVYPL